MTTLVLIVVLGLAMGAIALVGSVTLMIPSGRLEQLLLPLVALAAGSLLGGAFLHMLPAAIDELGNTRAVWLWFLTGFVGFFILEQCLHWHHCHRPVSQHRPVGHLILVADGLHNLIGGLAVGSAIVVDHRVGFIAWVAAVAHEIPQELGDFGILINSGWDKKRALAFNVASASTFLVGGLIAYALAGSVEVAFLLPFAAGNFTYIAATDLLPELTTDPALASKAASGVAFAIGIGVLLAAASFL